MIGLEKEKTGEEVDDAVGDGVELEMLEVLHMHSSQSVA